MSNLLNAIAQSEQQYQQQSPMEGRTATKPAASRRFSSWLLPAVLVVGPVAATLGYTQISQARAIAETSRVVMVTTPAGHTEPAMAPVVQATRPEAEITVLGEGEAAIRFLPYPELHTEPLPLLNHQRVSQSTLPSPGQRATRPADETKVVPVQPEEAEWGLEELDYSELSPQLAAQLKSAIAATEQVSDREYVAPEPMAEPGLAPAQAALKAIALGDLPASVQNRIPPLDFQTHIYSSSADSRWVKVNGREAFEGDEIAPGVILRRIEPRHVVFDYESYLIEMPALSEW